MFAPKEVLQIPNYIFQNQTSFTTQLWMEFTIWMFLYDDVECLNYFSLLYVLLFKHRLYVIHFHIPKKTSTVRKGNMMISFPGNIQPIFSNWGTGSICWDNVDVIMTARLEFLHWTMPETYPNVAPKYQLNFNYYFRAVSIMSINTTTNSVSYHKRFILTFITMSTQFTLSLQTPNKVFN